MLLNAYGKHKELVFKLCVLDPENAVYLIKQTAFERHCLVMILLFWEQENGPKPSLVELGEMLRNQPKKKLLKKFIKPYPFGLSNILSKLGRRVLVKERYFEIVDLLGEPNAAKTLRHLKTVNPIILATLKALPPAFRKPLIVRSIRDKSDLDELRYAITAVQAHVPDQSEQDLARSMEQSIKPMSTNKVYFEISEWLERRLRKTKLPSPPWKGIKKLRPLRTIEDIVCIANEFNNCLKTKIYDAVGHQYYYYVWRDKDKAVVELNRDPLLGWTVGEIQGPENKAVRAKTRLDIQSYFGKAGIFTFPNYTPYW